MIDSLPELPTNWIRTTFGDVCEVIRSGGTPKTNISEYYENGDIPFVKIEDINEDEKYLNYTKICITKKGLENSSAWIIPENSLLYSMYGSYGMPIINKIKVATNQAILGIIINHDYIYSDYVYYYLKAIKVDISKEIKGTTQLNLNKQIVKDYLFLLPPLGEQRRIVSRIEQLFTRLDEGVRSLQQAQTQLEQYKQATLQSTFEGYPQDILVQDISNLIQYGTSDKASTEKTGIPVLRMGNLQEMALDFSNLKYMPKDWDHPEITLNDGDVLFNRTNSAELVGKTAVYHSEYPKTTFASYLIRVNVDQKKYAPDLLSYYINSSYGKAYIKSVVSQQVGQANVNGTKLANMPIPNIPREEQITIKESLDEKLSIINDVKKDIEENIIKSNQLKQGVLKMAFEGKLGSQNPLDEPASVLLERIRAAKVSGRVPRIQRRLE